MQINTEGIVLRQSKAVGGKKVVTLLTKKYGKIAVGTTVAHKSKTKSALALSPFTLGNYQLFKNRGYYNMDSAEAIKSYFAIGEDVGKYMYSSYALELLDRLLPEEMSMSSIFTLTVNFFEAMEKRKSGYETLLLALEIKLLRKLGIFPRVEKCTCCERTDNLEFFSIEDGGVICSFCKVNKQDRLIYDANFGMIDIIKYFDKKPFKEFEKLNLKEETASKLQKVIKDYIAFHFDLREMKSETLLNIAVDNKSDDKSDDKSQ